MTGAERLRAQQQLDPRGVATIDVAGITVVLSPYCDSVGRSACTMTPTSVALAAAGTYHGGTRGTVLQRCTRHAPVTVLGHLPRGVTDLVWLTRDGRPPTSIRRRLHADTGSCAHCGVAGAPVTDR